MAAFGTDQETMQRLLTVETRKESQKTMLLTPIGSFLDDDHLPHRRRLPLCLLCSAPRAALPAKLDKIFPHFIEQMMPPVYAG